MRKRLAGAAAVLICGLALAAAVLYAGGRPSTGPLTAPEYSSKITGYFARFDNGAELLLSDDGEPIVLQGEMDCSGLNSGDRISIYCDGVMETYPAQAIVKEMVLHERGTAADLPQEILESLSGLGYEMKEALPPGETYRQITMAEAAAIFAEQGDYVILDVRRADEFSQGHIPGAINVANEDIGDELPKELPDREQTIYVYCRSGNRSKQAAEKLACLGYRNIIECGGIIDWTGEIDIDGE